MTELQELTPLLRVSAVACLLVLVAMAVDLCAGLRKAGVTGQARTSYALKRTATKFLTYEGGMVIAVGIDVLIHLCRLYALLGLDTLHSVPLITCLMGIFLLVVEGMSVHENATEKTKADFRKVASTAVHLTRDELAEIIADALRRTRGADEKGSH